MTSPFDGLTSIFSSGSSSGSGPCGSCAAKDVEIATLKAENTRLRERVKILEAVITNARRVAVAEEAKGKAGQLLGNPPIREGIYRGMEATGGKLKRIL